MLISTGRAHRALGRLAILAAVAMVFVACRPTAQDLASTLPAEINGHKTQVTVVGDELSGLATDDAIASLGKTRKDAAQATAVADPDVVVIAIAVNGVSGSDLRTALVEHWTTPGSATSTSLASKPVIALVVPGGVATYFYVRDPVVYVVETKDPASAASVLAALK